MFYTKYRPQKFSEISKPNEAADALAKQIASEKTAHAYLFVGPRGTGKTSTARILAKALNCPKRSEHGDPCDECSSCVAIKRGSYLDLIEIDAASNRGIDDIRELKGRVKLAPTAGREKVYIIDEVHMLTTEAFNALLKTLEEPPRNTVFILCTTELNKVPDTIKSRCQVFKFKRATIRQIVSKLELIVEEEAITIDKDDLEKIARASAGGFRDAETMLQQVADGEVTIDSLLNISSKEKYIEFCSILSTNSAAEALKIINKVFDEGVDIYVWTGEFIKHLRDLLLLKSGAPSDILEMPEEVLAKVKKQSLDVDLNWLVATLEALIDCQFKIKNSFVPQLPLEVAVVKICNLANSATTVQIPQKPLPQAPINKPAANVKVEIEETSEDDTEPTVAIAPTNIVSYNLTDITDKWAEVIKKIEDINKSILGLLRAGKPIAMEGQFLTLEVSYLFHKERLEAPRNREVLEKVLLEIFDSEIKVKCSISAIKPKTLKPQEVGVLTDFNVTVPSKDAVLDMLDGGLPL